MHFVRLGEVVLNLDRVSGIETYPYDGGPAIRVSCGEDYYRFTLRSDPEAFYTLEAFIARQITLADQIKVERE